jgi:membrane protease YdiL (CAAX protease family)
LSLQTQPEAAADRSRWRLRDAVGSFLGFVSLSLAGSYVGVVLLGGDQALVAIGSLLLGWVALAGVPLVAARRRGGSVRRDLRLSVRWVDVGIGVLAALSVLTAGLVYVLVLLALGLPVPTAAVADVAGGVRGPLLFVLAALIAFGAPVVEELHFRGLWWQALRARGLGPWPTVAVTAAVFALAHAEWARLPVLIAAGIAMGVVRLLTGRLGASIVCHLVINGLGAVALLAAA